MIKKHKIFQVIQEGVIPNGGRVERWKSCNGEFHVDFLIELFFEENGEVAFARQLLEIEVGQCDCQIILKYTFPFSQDESDEFDWDDDLLAAMEAGRLENFATL
ncbi:MAG TPA: hypothetical protein PLK35_00465 [Candidatus Moranbacteria bacterium]|nr:hypothetical protein [Candidatus Moranbacteria bacterium]